jgi:hypothetical protein
VFSLFACTFGRYSAAFVPTTGIAECSYRQQQDVATYFAKKTSNKDETPREESDDTCETIKAAFASLHCTIRDTIKRLTELSLKDYQWRSSVFKSNEADRLMEQALARMRGEDASYVRPMDAADEKIGPLVRIIDE